MIFLPLAFALLVLSLSFPAHSDGSLATTEADLQAISQDIRQLKGRLGALNKERSTTETRLLRTEKAIQQLQGDIRTVERQIGERQQQISQLKTQQRTLSEKRDRQKTQLAASLQSLYQSGRDSRIKLLLNQENPDELSRQLVYLDYFQTAQMEAVRGFEAILDRLQVNRQQQLQAQQQLQMRRDSLKEKSRQLEQEKRQRQTLINQLADQFRQGDSQLGQLEKQRQELEGILASLASQPADRQKPFARMKGRLPWPAQGKLLFGYNQSRSDSPVAWQGIFIATADNIQVSAVHDGQVVFADWLRGYGLLIIVDHGQGYLTLYAHNRSLLKKEGDQVLAGETLALAGETGGQPTAGLYFELRRAGKPEDPLTWLIR